MKKQDIFIPLSKENVLNAIIEAAYILDAQAVPREKGWFICPRWFSVMWKETVEKMPASDSWYSRRECGLVNL